VRTLFALTGRYEHGGHGAHAPVPPPEESRAASALTRDLPVDNLGHVVRAEILQAIRSKQ
jgi:hypothetical protein